MPKVKLLDTKFTDEIPKHIKCRMIMSGLTQTQLAEKRIEDVKEKVENDK